MKFISVIKKVLSDIYLPAVSDKNYRRCEAEITEDSLLVALNSIPNHETPGNDGLSEEFYETFWEDVKEVFINSLKQVKIEGSVSISQRQAVLKFLEKKRQTIINEN